MIPNKYRYSAVTARIIPSYEVGKIQFRQPNCDNVFNNVNGESNFPEFLWNLKRAFADLLSESVPGKSAEMSAIFYLFSCIKGRKGHDKDSY